VETARVSAQPTLRTARLTLGPLESRDAEALVTLAGAFAIADTTATIPHPYTPEDARIFLALDAAERAGGGAVRFAVRHGEGELVGVVGLHQIDRDQLRAELGYWIGVPWWGRGYATEAAGAVLRYGFDELGLHKIHAHYLARNPASGKVLERIGMRREGVLREEVRKWGRFEDVVLCGVLRADRPSPRR
jgi:RimJ/RimL family protein N-acetyltransferase